MGKKWKQWQTLFSWTPKSLQTVTAAMKLRHLLPRRNAMTNLAQCCRSVALWLFATPWTAARQVSLSITNSQGPPKLMSIESMMPSVVPFSSHLDSILKSRDITLLTKVRINKAMFFFPNSYIRMRELNYNEGWAPKNWWFWTGCWRLESLG